MNILQTRISLLLPLLLTLLAGILSTFVSCCNNNGNKAFEVGYVDTHQFPTVEESVQYYRECRKDPISETAFICATDIYWDFYFEGMKRYFSSNSVPVDETVLMHEVENVAKKDFENICYLAKKKYSEFFWLIREINNSRAPDDKQMALADLDVALHDARHNCRFVESALARYNDILDSDEVFEHLLPLLTPYDRSCIIKIHKIIFKDWKSL